VVDHFWVIWQEGQEAEQHDRDAIQGKINEKGLDPATLLVCREGHEKWEPAKGCGFQPSAF
jgi:hypothetical protein